MNIYNIKIRKKTIILSLFFLIFGAAIIIVSVFLGANDLPASAQALGSSEGRKIILIDAGHGGEDGGTSSESGMLEKDINLPIALYLRDYLTLAGFDVRMTRDTDTALSDKSLPTVRARKVSDLKNRVQMIQQNTGGILVSVHQNFFNKPKYSGTQVFYSSNNSQSMPIAESIRESVVSKLQPENKRELKDATSVYILKNAACPAVIVECGFLSNLEEAEKLSTEKYQKSLAFSICCGIVNYYK